MRIVAMKRFKPINLSPSDIERYWSKVNKTDSCWLWTAAIQQKGYGTLMCDKERHSVHRISWTLHNGQIPHGCFVCHKCDVPNCVNPEHLFLGDNTDNMQDASKKGRLKKPDNFGKWGTNGRSKLTASAVLEIKSLRGIISQRQIAYLYNMSKPAINHVLRGRVWGYVT